MELMAVPTDGADCGALEGMKKTERVAEEAAVEVTSGLNASLGRDWGQSICQYTG